MLKELEEFIQNNQDDIIVTGGITDEKINDLEESLGLEFRKEIRVIIPELSEPPVRTLGATIPENESHIFR